MEGADRVVAVTTVRRVYTRCNGGHYFAGGRSCPFDGWSSMDTEAIAIAAASLEKVGTEPSLENLREAGLPDAALARAVVMEFASVDSAFDALYATEVVVDGQPYPIHKAPHGVK